MIYRLNTEIQQALFEYILHQSQSILIDFRKFEKAAGMVSGRHYWIGYTDKAKEGQWQWLDGGDHGAVRWNTDQPDNWGNNEDCAGLLGNKNWKLNDWPCSDGGLYALCQHEIMHCRPGKFQDNFEI